MDFQKLYTELKNINDWFESREETLNRFQRIVTQREFEIALEDVKVGVEAKVKLSTISLTVLRNYRLET